MSLQTTKEISIDVSNYRYIEIDAKQYDRNLRYILITCENQGSLLPINKNTHFASIRYRKPDNNGVFNACEITEDGRILVELTEQMLAVAGTCYADVVIHKSVELVTDIGVNADGTLKLEDLHNNEIISSMTFIVHVYEAAFDNEEVESSYEYNKLNDLMAKAENTYVNVMNSCNNSKIAAAESEAKAKASEGKALASEQAAASSQSAASASQQAAAESASSASGSATAAANSAKAASDSQQAASGSAQAASDSQTAAANSASAASNSASAAATSQSEALKSQQAASASQLAAKTSETNAKDSEDNAKYYYELSASVAEGLVGGFIPIGTITFDELATVEKVTGYVYNISDDFVTTDEFREGAGKPYTAGTNVFVTASGELDCLGGAAPAIATVDEVKEYLGIQDDGEITE